MENTVGLSVIDHECDSYGIALGLSEEKIALLLTGLREVLKEELRVTERLEYAATLCSNANELAFCVFKLGEMHGATKLANFLNLPGASDALNEL